MATIAERYQSILKEIDQYKKGKHAVTVVGVAKYQPMGRLEEAIAAGIPILACNYAQEGQKFMEAFGHERVQWHFIGHIQSRKVKFLPDYDCVQSLDRLEIAESLNDRLAFQNKRQSVFVEVNIGEEEQKSGVMPGELAEFLSRLKTMPHLDTAGLMAMPPVLDPPSKRAPYFAEMKKLFDAFQSDYNLRELSIGTSEDFLVAVEEGSTMVRLGTMLLGERQLPLPAKDV